MIQPTMSELPPASPTLCEIFRAWLGARRRFHTNNIILVEFAGYLYTFNGDIRKLERAFDPYCIQHYSEFTSADIKLGRLQDILYLVDATSPHNLVFTSLSCGLTPTLLNFLHWEAKKAMNPDTTVLAAFNSPSTLRYFETFGDDAEYINELLDLSVCVSSDRRLGMSHLKFLSLALPLNELCRDKPIMTVSTKPAYGWSAYLRLKNNI